MHMYKIKYIYLHVEIHFLNWWRMKNKLENVNLNESRIESH